MNASPNRAFIQRCLANTVFDRVVSQMCNAAEYTVLFSNLTGCAVGISDINWSVKVVADSQASAIELALEQARVVNREQGMPPHGIQITEHELRYLAFVYGGPVPPDDSAAR